METTNPYVPKPLDPKIRLADGTEIRGQGGSGDPSAVWVWTNEAMSFLDAVTIFGDEEKTKRIEIIYSKIGDDHPVYEGYTKLSSVQDEPRTGGVRVRLEKGMRE